MRGRKTPDTRPSAKASRTPASGERAAALGLFAQYEVAAGLLLQALTEEAGLSWLALMDDEAGRLDDFQLAITDRLDAYQVKWSETGGQLAWSDLQRYLIDLLCDRRDLAANHPGLTVYGHLYTDRVPSSSRIGSAPKDDAGPYLTGRAVSELLQPAVDQHFQSLTDVPKKWRWLWDRLAEAAVLTSEELLAEMPQLRLEFGQQLPKRQPMPGQDKARFDRDIDDLFVALTDIPRQPERLVRLSREEVLARLPSDWRRRLEMASVHEFPPPHAYEPISSSSQELRAAIQDHLRGYVAVVGPPGAGKSTLLSEELKQRGDVAARYYAYVPYRGEVGPQRAEAANFLHDLILTLERSGLPRGPGPVDFDVAHLAERFRQQLAKLGHRFADDGQRAVVMIDGLDHVERADPAMSLFAYLPLPDDIPDGVLFVVGSQTVRMLNQQIVTQLEQPGRTVVMRGLDAGAVSRLAESAGVAADAAELLRATDGHPLLLDYVLEQLRGLPADEQAQAVASIEPLGGDVRALYDRLWTGGIRDDPELVELLALISRMRAALDLDWLRDRGQPAAVVRKLQDRYAHLFRRDDARWYFFHDSFRLYLQQKTGTDGHGTRYHRQLAEMCAATGSADAMQWEVLFHLASADAHKEVLAKATPAFFRQQLFALRPPTLIGGDIALAARSLAVCQDPMALVRLAMAAYELTQRSYQEPDRKKFLELLLWLGQWRAVVDLLEVERDDLASNDPRELSLELATDLWLHGHEEEARRLLVANEPYDLLRGQRRIRPYREAEDLLCAWAKAAVLVYGADAVLEAVSKLDLGDIEQLGARKDEDITPRARAWMLALASEQADAAGLNQRASRVREALDLEDANQRTAWARTQLSRAPNDEAGLEEVLRLQPGQLPGWERVWVATLLCERNRLEEVAEWIAGLDQPAPARAGVRDPWTAEGTRYQLCFAQAVLGQDIAPVPTASDTRSEAAAAKVAEVVIAMAKLRARALIGPDLSPEDFVDEVRTLFASLEAPSKDPLDNYPLRQAQPGALATAVRVAENYGEAHVRALWAYLRQRWADRPPRLLVEGNRVIPRVEGTRAVAPGELRAMVDRLAQASRVHSEPSARAGDLVDIAQTCLALGDVVRGGALLEEAVRSTLAVYPDKDRQLTSWIELLRPRLDQENGPQMVRWLAGVLRDLGGVQADDAAQRLLADEARIRPGLAWSVGRWLADQGVIDWDDRLLTLLRGTEHLACDELWWIVLTDAYLPIGHGRRYGLLELGAKEALDARGAEWTAQQLKRLAARIEVDAPPDERDHWRWELADAAAEWGLDMSQVGLADELHPQRRPPRSRRRGTGEEEQDAYLAATDTPDKVLAALQAGDGHSSSKPLDEALDRVARALTSQQLRQFAALDDSLLETDHLLTLVETALRLDELGLARELIERGLRRADASGWRRQWDGGTLLKLMVSNWELDPEEGRRRAYVRFAVDASTDRWLLSGAADDLMQYVDLFGIDDRQALAQEVESYVRRLVEEPSSVPTGVDNEDADPLVVLSKALPELMSEPYRLGLSAAQQALLSGLKTNQQQVGQEIGRCLANGANDELLLRLFSVLEAHVSSDGRLDDELLDQVEVWAASEHLPIRLAAQRLLRAHGRDAPPVARRRLPAELESPIAPQGGGEWPSEPQFIEDDVGSEFHRSMRPRVRGLAEVAFLDPEGLGDYIAERAAASRGGSLPDDAALRTDRGVLGWTFFPPSVELWDHAAARTASLLVDAGRIEPEVAQLGTTGALYDPDLIAVRPQPQPAGLPSALAGHEHRWVSEESWLAPVASAHQRLMQTVEDWVVIGEYTDVRYLDREMPRERRWQCLSGQADEEIKARPPLFGSCLLAEVKRGEIPGSDYPLSAQRDLDFRGPGAWLALSPFVANACGWTPSDGGLLPYRDEVGVVAKSLWWRNGWLDASNWASHDEVGEGWLVLVAPRGLAVLEEALGEALDVSWMVKRDFLVAGKPATADDSGRRSLPTA